MSLLKGGHVDAMPHNMAELVHALDLGSNPREGVQVRVLRLIGGRRASLHCHMRSF